MKSYLTYFTKREWTLWLSSIGMILLFYFLFDRGSTLTLIASLLGATSLIFNAKGNPFGQILMIVFSILYGIISYSFAYYGEMITYLGMTAPMALLALISWLRHPYRGNRAQVAVNRLREGELLLALILTALVTVAFCFILQALGAANLFLSTFSVATSFFAVYLTFRRSPYFALAYAANDIVLILLWAIAAFTDASYLSVMICFIMFLANDIYGFMNWREMQRRQNREN